jgi:multicomponent Na+:H+ antiporter subunit E
VNDFAVSPAVKWQHYSLVFFTSALLWLLLTGSLAGDELFAGLLVSLAVTLLFGNRFAVFTGFRFSWMAPLYVLDYLRHFFIALIGANLDLASRVLNPVLPINPHMVEITTQLKSPLARMLLANTITLTPGTLTVDVTDDRLLVHWVNCPPGIDSETATKEIAGRFEQAISRFLL